MAICDHRTKKNQMGGIKSLTLVLLARSSYSATPIHGQLISVHTCCAQLLSEDTFTILTEENERRESRGVGNRKKSIQREQSTTATTVRDEHYAWEPRPRTSADLLLPLPKDRLSQMPD